jgi:hypothetical protein
MQKFGRKLRHIRETEFCIINLTQVEIILQIDIEADQMIKALIVTIDGYNLFFYR